MSTQYGSSSENEMEATRLGSSTSTEPYMGGTDYGSGMTGGPGAGNKTSGSYDSTSDSSDTRFGSHGDTSSYSGGTKYGSGTTGGAG